MTVTRIFTPGVLLALAAFPVHAADTAQLDSNKEIVIAFYKRR
jgi:hypothetical protein